MEYGLESFLERTETLSTAVILTSFDRTAARTTTLITMEGTDSLVTILTLNKPLLNGWIRMIVWFILNTVS